MDTMAMHAKAPLRGALVIGAVSEAGAGRATALSPEGR